MNAGRAIYIKFREETAPYTAPPLLKLEHVLASDSQASLPIMS
jgi:hypothetical protein